MRDSRPEDNKKIGTKEGHKRQRESGSQMDEDCHSGGSHCCETSARFLEMNAKLDKLLGFFSEMEDLKMRLTVVESENKSLKKGMKFINEDLEVKTTSTSMGAITNKNTEDIKSLERSFLSLKRRNIKLEAYTRRENIKIFNIKENEGENSNTESLVPQGKDENFKGR